MTRKIIAIMISTAIILLLFQGCRLNSSDELIIKKIEARLNALHVSAASIAIFDETGVIWSRAFGRISSKDEHEADNETIFRLASLTKVITGTAVMQLYERGLIDLQGDVNDYLPFSVRHPNFPETAITMHMLLTHSSGIRDNWTVIEGDFTSYDPSSKQIPGLSEACAGYFSEDGRWYDDKKNFTEEGPAGLSEYSNMAITLAGLIVQRVSGMPFEEYCEYNIIEPLGIDGGWNLLPQHTADMAFPADYDHADLEAYTGSAFPAGFFSCSSGDFASLASIFFNKGLCNGERILQEETTELMLSMQSSDYCYIWKPTGFTYGGEHMIHHTGGMDGTRTGVFLSQESGTGAVILTSGEFDFPYTYYDIIKILLDYGRGQ